jgi:hypothetical protein
MTIGFIKADIAIPYGAVSFHIPRFSAQATAAGSINDHGKDFSQAKQTQTRQ